MAKATNSAAYPKKAKVAWMGRNEALQDRVSRRVAGVRFAISTRAKATG